MNRRMVSNRMVSNRVIINWCQSKKMYSDIVTLQETLENLNKRIETQQEKNKHLGNALDNLLSKNNQTSTICDNKMLMKIRKEKLENKILADKKKLKQQLLDYKHELEVTRQHLNEIATKLETTEKLNEEPSISSVKDCRERCERAKNAFESVRGKLLQKIARISNLTPTGVFNINLKRLESLKANPADYNEWVSKLPPEQLSVLINYTEHLVKLFVKYHFYPIRYQFDDNNGLIVDNVTGKKLKLYEENYRIFKKENTLVSTMSCLNSIVQNLHSQLESTTDEIYETYSKFPLGCLQRIATSDVKSQHTTNTPKYTNKKPQKNKKGL